MVNGNTWPFQTVEQRRYRLRVLNGCQVRFLILDFSRIPGVQVWQIGNEGGFLDRPVHLTAVTGNRLLMGTAERADLSVDFPQVPTGAHVLHNLGPDEPYGRGVPGVDFTPADPQTTGQIMQFRVVPAAGADRTTPPQFLDLPPLERQHRVRRRRRLALVEEAAAGRTPQGTAEGPVAALLGLVKNGVTVKHPEPRRVRRAAHQAGRAGLDPGPWERGFKDTVAALPGHVTRVRADFDVAGQYVWHCHIVEHEDNEMMRPYRIGPRQPG